MKTFNNKMIQTIYNSELEAGVQNPMHLPRLVRAELDRDAFKYTRVHLRCEAAGLRAAELGAELSRGELS